MDVIAATPKGDDAQQHWQTLEALFHRALDVPGEQRAAMAREWCGSNSAMYDELMELLASDSSVENKIAASPTTVGSGLLPRTVDPVQESAEEENDPWIGRTLGPYRLESLLGRGGMGVVYLGRRLTGGFDQTVAIKLVGRHMRSEPALSQFLLERDALALLEHKNIARLLDGGITTEGLPYVVMDYVEGHSLDRVCEDPATSMETLLQLMIQLCEAVDYVHRNLILHRDLKPGNVLVTTEGAVKLLDFGTVKLIGPAAVDSAMTQAGMRPLTLRYASPEHIMGKPVSTATDIYSLGMILYRLLAGRVPDSLEEGRIRPPSQARVRELKAGRAAGAPQSSLEPQMAKDLDAIVLKAIRTEPEKRYSSAGAMAADIALALADRPVLARRGTFRYRAAKFYKRNAAAIYAGVAVFLVLAIGLSVMARESYLARQQELRAEQGVVDEQKLAHTLLFDFFEELKQISGSTDAQRKTVSEALQYLDGLATSKVAAGSSLEADEVEGYTEMGNLLGSPYEQNLGDVPGAIKTLDKAVALARQMVMRDPHNLETLQKFSDAELALGRIYFGTGEPKEALKYLQPAADSSAEIARSPHATAAMLAQSASVWDMIGDLYGLNGAVNLGDIPKSLEDYQRAEDYHTTGLRLDPTCDRCRRGAAVEFWKMGNQTEDSDPVRTAENDRKGLADLAEFAPDKLKSPRVQRIDTLLREKLGIAELKLGHTTEALGMLQQVQQRLEQAIAADAIDSRARFDLAVLDEDLSNAYSTAGDDRQALAADQEMLSNMNFLLRRDPSNAQWQYHHANALIRCGEAERKLGDKEEGDRTFHQGLDQIVALAQKKDASSEALTLAAQNLLTEKADPAHLQTALGFAQRSVDISPQPDVEQFLTLADAKKATGDLDGARALAAKVLQTSSASGKSTLSAENLKHVHSVMGH